MSILKLILKELKTLVSLQNELIVKISFLQVVLLLMELKTDSNMRKLNPNQLRLMVHLN